LRRLFGLLTSRAAATLLAYTYETNQNMAQWLNGFLHEVRRRRQHAAAAAGTLSRCAAEPGASRRNVERGQRRGHAAQAALHGTAQQPAGMPHSASPNHRSICSFVRLQEMQVIANPYTGETLSIDPRNLAQRILEARSAHRWSA
jgi:hypothetical protein